MRKILTLVASLLMVVTMMGCSQTVPTGHVAKKIAPSGVLPEVYQTGKTWVGFRERLVFIDVSSELRHAPVKVIMADFDSDGDGNLTQKIGLNMDFVVNIRYRLKDGDQVLTAMMKDMKLNNVNVITAEQIYAKYGNMIVGRVSREVLGQYTPEEVLDNLDNINKTLDSKIKDAFESTPLVASSVSLGPVSLPKIIVDRVNANKSTELSIAEKRAAQEIKMLEKQNDIALAREEAIKQKIDAESLAEQNRILAKSITPEVLRLRELAIQEKQIDMMREGFATGNVNATFIPYNAMESTGAQVRMFNNK